MDYFKTVIFWGLLLCCCHGLLYAEQAPESLALREHFKVVTVDATPNDPGQVEFWGSYVIQGGKFACLQEFHYIANPGFYSMIPEFYHFIS